MTPQLKRFLESLQVSPDPSSLAWDTAAVETLDAAERTVAEDALIARARNSDVRAIKSLALLGVMRAAPTLQAVKVHGSPMARNSAERALGVLTGDQATIAALVDSLGGEVDAFTAWDLKSMPGAEAFRGLLVALSSGDLPARMHALDGLADRTRVTSLREPAQSPLGRYELLLGSGLKSLYLPAAQALADRFTQLETGVAAETLGLVYVPSSGPVAQAYWESCGDTGKPYADELLPQMSEHDLAWAQALVAARVEDRDTRSLDTIEARHLAWTVPVLAEVAARDAQANPQFAERARAVAALLVS